MSVYEYHNSPNYIFIVVKATDEAPPTTSADTTTTTESFTTTETTPNSRTPTDTSTLLMTADASSSCPRTLRLPEDCDYESTSNGSIDSSNHWKITKGGSASVGPQSDNTKGTADGNYLLLSNSAEPRWLELHMSATGIPCDICLSFYYSMQVSTLGALGIFWQNFGQMAAKTGTGTLIGFDINSTLPNQWKHHTLTIRLVWALVRLL